jgi:NTE family protein
MKNKITTIVLGGGGVKGLSHIGAFKLLEEKNILENIETYAGTSCGILLGFLLSIGWKAIELEEFFIKFDLLNMASINLELDFMVNNKGIDDGKNLKLILEQMMEYKNIPKNITFKDLYNITKKKIIITGSCINTKKIEYFSHDITPNMEIITALRITSSVPFYYIPVEYDNKIYIDGGCIDNFPIHLFNKSLKNVIGIYLMDSYENIENIESINDYILNIYYTLSVGVNKNTIKNYKKYTIIIPLNNISIMDFNKDENEKIKLIKQGYDIANQYFINRFN